MITRKLEYKDIEEAFFEISEKPVFIELDLKMKKASGYKALVDSSNNSLITIVSNKYHLITNKDAYNVARDIVPLIFKGMHIEKFKCYNIIMPKSKGSCIIDLVLPTTDSIMFGEEWTPFIRITNSYNKTLKLGFEIGFCRWICLNGAIFGENVVSFSINHTKEIDISSIVNKVHNDPNLYDIQNLWAQFNNGIERLKEIRVAESLCLPLFCKVFGVQIATNSLSERQKENIGIQASRIKEIASEYIKELGNTAYAMFNVFTDFASYPVGIQSSNLSINAYQHKVGTWLKELSTNKTDINSVKYIGEKNFENALFMESQIKYKGRP